MLLLSPIFFHDVSKAYIFCYMNCFCICHEKNKLSFNLSLNSSLRAKQQVAEKEVLQLDRQSTDEEVSFLTK